MPLIDKPLPELFKYEGRNPRPHDFDSYWSAALNELDGIDPRPKLELTRDAPSRHSDCFDLWFSSVGGARIYAKYMRPKAGATGLDRKHPAVLQFHGYALNSGPWAENLGWPSEGFCYAAMDCRGQGGRSQDTTSTCGTTLRGHVIRGLDDPDPRKLLFRQIYLDTVQLARVVMNLPEVDAGRVGCFGNSQGGGLTLACAGLEPRIRRAAPINPFLCDYQRYWEMDLVKEALEDVRYFFRMFDPLHKREGEIFTKLGYIDCQHLAGRIKADVLLQTGLMDSICPPSTQFGAYNKITGKKDILIYPDYAHENLPGASDRIMDFMHGL